MPLPNFLVIGVTKAGTTSLHHYLGQHPDISVTRVKETNFFCFEGEDRKFLGPGDEEIMGRILVTRLEDYEAQFSGAGSEKAVGEICSSYLYYPKAAQRIKDRVPKAKLIAVLRHPVDRAYSSFLHLLREGHETVSDFAKALALEEARIRDNWRYMWHYRKIGLYYDQVKRYLALFEPSQIRIYLYEEDFVTRPFDMLRDTFRFLGVDEGFVPDMTVKYNVTGIPRSRGLRDFYTKPNLLKKVVKPLLPKKLRYRLKAAETNLNLRKPPVSPELRQKLISYYQDDILKLQELIGRDLTSWMA